MKGSHCKSLSGRSSFDCARNWTCSVQSSSFTPGLPRCELLCTVATFPAKLGRDPMYAWDMQPEIFM